MILILRVLLFLSTCLSFLMNQESCLLLRFLFQCPGPHHHYHHHHHHPQIHHHHHHMVADVLYRCRDPSSSSGGHQPEQERPRWPTSSHQYHWHHSAVQINTIDITLCSNQYHWHHSIFEINTFVGTIKIDKMFESKNHYPHHSSYHQEWKRGIYDKWRLGRLFIKIKLHRIRHQQPWA